tara:strand:- start:392 stop:544 length:153 start_codon:yes stop_codon:yes gene_type:complete
VAQIKGIGTETTEIEIETIRKRKSIQQITGPNKQIANVAYNLTTINPLQK